MFSKDQTENVFRGLSPTPICELPISKSFSLLVHFYETLRSSDALPAEQDGDMLLYQWGTYDWGQGSNFTVNLTRQLIYPEGDFDQEIWQLGLTYNYPPSASLDLLKSGDQWCYTTSGINEFAESMFSSAALSACVDKEPSAVALTWERQ